MLGSDNKIFLFVKMLSWPRDMTEYTLLPDQSLFGVKMYDITGKEALSTDYYY